MAEMVRIRKGTIETTVHEAAFESAYKPLGWVVVENNVENPIDREFKEKGITDENQQNEYLVAKRERSKRRFNDGLFKEE